MVLGTDAYCANVAGAEPPAVMPEPEVFVSYNRADGDAAEAIAEHLRQHGIEPWLDVWTLVPGDLWQAKVEDALAKLRVCAVLVGPSGLGRWQEQEARAAIARRVADGGESFRVIPVLLPGAERGGRTTVPTFLAAAVWVEFGPTIDDAKALHRLVSGIRGQEPGNPVELRTPTSFTRAAAVSAGAVGEAPLRIGSLNRDQRASEGPRHAEDKTPTNNDVEEGACSEPHGSIASPSMADPPHVVVYGVKEDEAQQRALVQQLAPLQHRGVLTLWDSATMPAGAVASDELKSQMGHAAAVVLVVSASMIADPAARGGVMKWAAERFAAGSAKLFWVIARACLWNDDLPFGAVRLPRSGPPIGARAEMDRVRLLCVATITSKNSTT